MSNTFALLPGRLEVTAIRTVLSVGLRVCPAFSLAILIGYNTVKVACCLKYSISQAKFLASTADFYLS